MREIAGLSKPYVTVAGSYGGSQSFFKEKRGYFNKCKNAAGCGIVAMLDVLRYLQSDTVFNSAMEYIESFNKISRIAFWIPNPTGLSFIQQQLALGLQFVLRKLPYMNYWGFSRKKLYPRIKNMLNKDIPVILCIPKVLGRRAKTDNLKFYNKSLAPVAEINGHFIVVTGVVEIDGKIYLRISSWGREYYISYEEYIVFLKKHILGFLGNIMCIYER